MAKKQKGSDSIIIPWDKEEESGGGGVRVKEGDYKVKIVGAKHKKSSEKETPYIELKLKLMEGKKKGKVITERVFVTPKSVQRVRMLLQAVGVKPPKKGKKGVKASKLDLSKLVGKIIGVSIEDDEEYKGKIRSRVAFEGFLSLDDLKGADEDDDEDDDEEDEDEDTDDDDESDDDDEDEDDDDEDDDDDVDELDLDDEL